MTRGQRIRAARQDAGITQHELGVSVGSQAFEVSRWELDRHRPTTETLARLALALKVRVDWLEGGTAAEKAA